MIHIYNQDNTDFEKNGNMTLMPTTATVHAILNGAWTAELSHPIDDTGRWKYIKEEAVIKMPSFNGMQLFRIKKVRKSDGGVTANMEPIFMDAAGDCFLTDIRPTEKNGQQALDIMCTANSKYSGRSDIQKTATAYYEYKNLIEAINGDDENSFINRWGGELIFDNFQIEINERAGGDYGIELKYGKNIPADGLTEEVDTSAVITRIYPKAYNGYTITNNGYVDSPVINRYATIKAATMTFDDVKMREDAQEGDEEDGIIICDTQEELDEVLIAKCNAQYEAGADKPSISISANIVLLQNTEQYKEYKILEDISLGDTIHCKHSKLDIITEARVIELEYDCISKKVKAVTLGDFEYNYFDNVTSATNRIDEAIRQDGSVVAEQVKGIIDGVKSQMRAQSSIAKKQDVRAIIFEDFDEESPTHGAMCLGTMGFQIANRRTADNKDWDWSTFGTGQGFFADFIVAGTMLADRIKGGTLELGGENNGNGIARVRDASGKEIIRLAKDGVYAKGKYICDDAGGSNRRIILENGNIGFTSKNNKNPIWLSYVPSGGKGGFGVYSGNTMGEATGTKTLMRIFHNAIYLDAEMVGPDGYTAKTGKVEFSDGTYLEFRKGFLMGGKTKEGEF